MLSIEPMLQIRSLGLRLRIARKRRGWNIAETAARAGVNRNTLNKLELGKPGVSVATLASVLWVLELHGTLAGVANPVIEDIHGAFD